MRRTLPRGSLFQVSVVPTRLVRCPVRGSVAARCSQIRAKGRRELRAAKYAALALRVCWAPLPPCAVRVRAPAGAGLAPSAQYVKQPPQAITDKRLSGYAGDRSKLMGREGGCSSSILDKDKAGALVTLLLLSVPVPMVLYSVLPYLAWYS